MTSDHKLSKKDLRKKLEEDELAVLLTHLRDDSSRIWHEHGKSVVFGLILVVCLGLIWWAYATKSASDVGNRQALLNDALEQVALAQQGQQQGNPVDEYFNAAVQSLDDLLRNHGSSNTATAANLLRGYCSVQLGDAESGEQFIQKALSRTNDPGLKPLLQLALIQASATADGDPSATAAELRKLQEDLGEGQLHEMVTYLLAKAEERAGNEAEALAQYRSLPEDAVWRNLAQQDIIWLETEPAVPLQSAS